jgi:hypothetical protein
VFYLCPTLTRLRLDTLLLLMLYDTLPCNLPHWNHISFFKTIYSKGNSCCGIILYKYRRKGKKYKPVVHKLQRESLRGDQRGRTNKEATNLAEKIYNRRKNKLLEGVYFFSRTRLSAYVIKKKAVTYRQAREHLAQAQRKKEEEK